MYKQSSFFVILFVFILLKYIFALNNGLALTPPMGWLAWERFQCNTRCDRDPKNCIREELFMEMADKLVEDGYRDAGYEYVNIDDCWMSPSRAADGNLYPDPKRFPSGIKFLADYMHSRGLKLGIYQDFGTKTCMGYPGIVGHMEQDAGKFAEWGIDMVKIDACHSHPFHMDKGYIDLGKYLNRTGRPMVYSCSWPYYQLLIQMEPKYKWIREHCNLWRNYHDITDSWKSIQNVIDFFGDNQEVLSPHTGPGHWNDPDMLMIGNSHLSPGQSRAQMAVWCILPAPLLMSNDLRHMKEASRFILTNRGAIRINQDPLGLPGKRVYKKHLIEIWKRAVQPVLGEEHSWALVLLNRNSRPRVVTFHLRELGLDHEAGYRVTSIFHNTRNWDSVPPNTTLHIPIQRTDAVMLKFEIIIK